MEVIKQRFQGEPQKCSKEKIVDPACSGAIASPEEHASAGVGELCAPVLARRRWEGWALKTGDLIDITGVGFCDFEHGQSGVAPNAIELHPVLSIQRVD